MSETTDRTFTKSTQLNQFKLSHSLTNRTLIENQLQAYPADKNAKSSRRSEHYSIEIGCLVTKQNIKSLAPTNQYQESLPNLTSIEI